MTEVSLLSELSIQNE